MPAFYQPPDAKPLMYINYPATRHYENSG